ncbi:hypothetical protein [Frateuria defendens]|uniref:hypothetical protein n=1 Tax=Frateuria defendens TaxID=2219559 RepID=UPI00066FDCC3|nr:hypothetical protein [Frateuria defendens]
MGHDKTRSQVTVSSVDWSDPHLNELLKKVDGWSIDHRSHLPPQEVEIRVICGWEAADGCMLAQLLAESDGGLVLATRTPLPPGVEVRVSAGPGDGQPTRWGVVLQGRESRRVEDRGDALYLSWLRAR